MNERVGDDALTGVEKGIDAREEQVDQIDKTPGKGKDYNEQQSAADVETAKGGRIKELFAKDEGND